MPRVAGKEFADTVEFVSWCVRTENLHLFYTWSAWLRVRVQVLEADRYECQYCKAKGKYRKAALVHHVNHIRNHPELALSQYYIDDKGIKRRQLISCCEDCHAEQHPDRLRRNFPRKPLTEERW